MTTGGVVVDGSRIILVAESGQVLTVTVGKFRAEFAYTNALNETWALTVPRKPDAARFALALVTLLMEAEATPA